MRIVLGPTGAHLTAGDVALCGADVRGRKTVALEPGMEMGEHPHDCKACVAAWKREATP